MSFPVPPFTGLGLSGLSTASPGLEFTLPVTPPVINPPDDPDPPPGGDPGDPGSPARGWITYDGENYQLARVARTALEEAGDQARPTASIGIGDPGRSILKYLLERHTRKARARVTIIRQCDLDDPTKAIRTYRQQVLSIRSTESPPQTVAELGAPDIFDATFPTEVFSRDRCAFVYRGRRCGYPGDEFGEASIQSIVPPNQGEVPEVPALFGWRARESQPGPSAETFAVVDGSGLEVSKDGTDIRHLDAYTNGIEIYKRLPTYSLVDFNTSIRVDTAFTDKLDWYMGLLVRSRITPSSWIIGGVAAGGTLRLRVTESGTSTDYEVTEPETELLLRLAQVEDTMWKLYTAPDDGAETPSWTARITISTTELDEDELEVGLVLCSDEPTSPRRLQARFDWFRVDSGGLDSCDFTEGGSNGCAAHDNAHRFGAAPLMGDRL